MRAEDAVAAFSGERLRLARFRVGLTLRELAERVDVTITAISQYENDHNRPTAAVLARLAMATGVSAGFFTFGGRPISRGGLDGTHFRSLRSTTRQARAQAWGWSELVLDVAEVLERYVRLPDASVPLVPLSVDAEASDFVVRQRICVPRGNSPTDQLATWCGTWRRTGSSLPDLRSPIGALTLSVTLRDRGR